VQASSNTQAPSISPVPTSTPVARASAIIRGAPVVNNGATVGYAMPMIPAPNSGQAFGNDAVKISAPSTIKAGEIANMTITVTVPDNATGSYYSSIDINVNNEENNQYNPQLGMSFAVQQSLTELYVKSFSTTMKTPVMIEVSADSYSSDSGTRISPKKEDPSFDLELTCNGDPVNLTFVKTVGSGNVGTGNIYPTWISTTENAYQSYGEHYVETYKANGAVGDYQLSILPKNTTNFGYSTTVGNNT
jgi:hypothetical protein